MNDAYKHYLDIPQNEKNVLVPTMIESKMTGVLMAEQTCSGLVTLVYTDNTRESALLPEFNLVDSDSFFEVVDKVQSQRKDN